LILGYRKENPLGSYEGLIVKEAKAKSKKQKA
jgi:hypothetical protein